eukprot:285682-Chlamydomonas_euryale.AAC.1
MRTLPHFHSSTFHTSTFPHHPPPGAPQTRARARAPAACACAHRSAAAAGTGCVGRQVWAAPPLPPGCVWGGARAAAPPPAPHSLAPPPCHDRHHQHRATELRQATRHVGGLIHCHPQPSHQRLHGHDRGHDHGRGPCRGCRRAAPRADA